MNLNLLINLRYDYENKKINKRDNKNIIASKGEIKVIRKTNII